MKQFFLSRYEKDFEAISNLHRLDDALDVVTFLTAESFVAKKLIDRHRKSQSEANFLSKRIVAHARIAGKFARLSLASEPAISFLPAYYAILNLAKVCCLAGKYSSEFTQHSRWHGATYNTQSMGVRALLTDSVTVKKGGALALFYKTLTNQDIEKDRLFKLRDVYPLVPGVSSEFEIVSGSLQSPLYLEFTGKVESGILQIEVEAFTIDSNSKKKPFNGNVRSIPPLKGFRKKPKSKATFHYKGLITEGEKLIPSARKVVRTEFLRIRTKSDYTSTYLQNSQLPLPEEFATGLAFFHLSSVCRYNPELWEKFSTSVGWPLLLAMRRHSLYYFLISVWSFITQENYMLFGD